MVSNDLLQPASVRLVDLLCGALHVTTSSEGWVRPSRFNPAQFLALTSCMAWHPGLYRQMANTTAGICLRFATDATEVALAVRYDDEPSGTAAVLDNIPQRAEAKRQQAETDLQLVYDLRDYSVEHGPYDGFSVVVDGRPLGASFPQAGVLRASLRDPREDTGDGVVALPGLGQRHEVTIWLPCLRGCTMREIWTNGTYVEPLGKRHRMLVLGDSVGQGFCSGDPALAWPALVADQLGLELVNQSLGGQVFQPTALIAADMDDVEHIVVELGLNYRWERCSPTVVKQDVRGVLFELSKRWSKAHLWVLTPIWFNQKSSPVIKGSCYDLVAQIIGDAARRYGATLVDGSRLMDHSSALFEDGVVHPGAKGHEQMAQRLIDAMIKEVPSLAALNSASEEADVAEEELAEELPLDIQTLDIFEDLDADRGPELSSLEENSVGSEQPLAAHKVAVEDDAVQSIRARKKRRRS